MIVIKRTLPIRIRKNEALLSRLHAHHSMRKIIEADTAKRKKGYYGEKSLDYFLNFLPKRDYYIFHGLRLPHNNFYFQIDLLIATTRFLLIIEIKNVSGTVILGGPFKQMIRILDSKEEKLPDPISQVKRQKYQFQQLLEKEGFKDIPIEHLVIFSNSSTIINAADNNSEVIERVSHSNQLMSKIKNFEKNHKIEYLDGKTIKKICRLLKKQHTPPQIDILQTYDIPPTQIIQGVICPECSTSPMKRIRGSWSCSNCQAVSDTAHIKSIVDYLLVVNPSISNHQAREFLQISSRTVASKLLGGMELHSSGSTKGTTYTLPPSSK